MMIFEAAAGKDLPIPEVSEAARLRAGDPAAFNELVARYQHRLYRYLTRLVRDRTTADDLFQQTWLQVVRQVHRYDPARSFDTWLFAIAHNAAMDLLRRRRGEVLEDYPMHAPDALDRLIAGERAATIAKAMEALPAAYREALTLRFEDGMKLEEIAAVTGTPLSTVKSRVHRGLEAVRRMM
jgi:RNA polymerase sigma-70 factor (ECF subfamily)